MGGELGEGLVNLVVSAESGLEISVGWKSVLARCQRRLV
jgi:hypothetical protein